MTVAGLLVLPPLLMILFRRKYPRWWFDWNLQLLRLHNRINVYLLLLRDEYPSTDEDQAVHLDVPYPDALSPQPLVALGQVAAGAARTTSFWRVLNLVAAVMTVVAWFAILFTGRYPRGLFEFVVGVLRWNNRVIAYAFILATDAYPPFRLSPDVDQPAAHCWRGRDRRPNTSSSPGTIQPTRCTVCVTHPCR